MINMRLVELFPRVHSPTAGSGHVLIGCAGEVCGAKEASVLRDSPTLSTVHTPSPYPTSRVVLRESFEECRGYRGDGIDIVHPAAGG